MADQCTATAKSTGQRCTRPCVAGAVVCRFHGGAAPQVAGKAVERLAEVEARRLLDVIGVEPVDDVLGALSQLAGEVVAWKNVMGDQVAALEALRFESGEGTEQLRAEVAVFERAMSECRRTLVDIAKLNIESRLARVSEQHMEVMLKMVNAALVAAGVSGAVADEARAAASDVGRRHLEVVRSA